MKENHRYVFNWLRNNSNTRIETDPRDVKQTEKAEANHDCNFSNVRACHIYQQHTNTGERKTLFTFFLLRLRFDITAAASTSPLSFASA